MKLAVLAASVALMRGEDSVLQPYYKPSNDVIGHLRNGAGRRSGAAASKRAAKRRRNIRKHGGAK